MERKEKNETFEEKEVWEKKKYPNTALNPRKSSILNNTIVWFEIYKFWRDKIFLQKA